MGDPFAGVAAWATDLIHRLGYVGVAALVALENLFPPVPSELILPLSGFLVGQGRLGFVGVVLAATAGSLVGALALYGLGRWLGEERLRGLVRRFGGLLFVEEKDIDRAQRWFEDHGGKAVLIGRFVPGVRSLISVPAGVGGMALGPFLAYTAIGSGLWNAALIGLGWALGARWEEIKPYAQVLEYAVLAGLMGLVGWFVWRRRRARA
jgi:membrane protein DedA with SNARE-associated domain